MGGTYGVTTATFKNTYTSQTNEELSSLLADPATQVVFFGEGAGLGMLSVSSIVNASEVPVQGTRSMLQTLTKKLQAERVNPNTTKLPWCDVMAYFNASTGASPVCTAGEPPANGHQGKESECSCTVAVDDKHMCAKRVKLCHDGDQSEPVKV